MDDSNAIASGLYDIIQEFIENEARSCSMDFGCVTPLYVYRMWGGSISIEDIEIAMKHIRTYGY